MASRLPSMYGARSMRQLSGYRPGPESQTLEIPSAWNTPTRGDVVRRVDPSPIVGNNSGCDCPKSGPQGPNQYGQPQNPYQMPGPQGLSQPPVPQKPFQVPTQDPCEMNNEIMKGLGLDPDCMGNSRSPRRTSAKPRKARKRQPMTRIRKRRSPTKMTTRQLFPKATKPAGSGKYRTLANGACYDTVRRQFVKKSNC